jgi:aspartyl-tRNA(Asn)/glutamyl-tRNA(Gln) amidotransferase subunit B
MAEINDYEIVVGLEVHAQLLTKSKLFCGDSTAFGREPNTQISSISLAHPGTLPKMNKEVIQMAVKLGLACHCQIVQRNYFARKNYFYPDLPKGYQISQHTTPICKNGYVEVVVGKEVKKIRLNRIHMEEDAGKSVHEENSDFSNIDYNRAGMPLLEIVTEPDIRSAEEAFAYVTALRKLVRHLEVCDGNMEQGSLRCDVNISVRKKGDEKLGTKVEVKNLNSIRFIKKAIESESKRLIALHRKGEAILQQTRGLNENDFTTYAIRTKEDEDDYRYFPEPDLPPFFITNEMIEAIRLQMPASAEEIKKELLQQYQLTEYDALQLSDDIDLGNYFRAITKETNNYKAGANWTLGSVKNYISANDLSLDEFRVQPIAIAQLINLIDEGKISFGTASQKILPELINDPSLNIETFIEEKGLKLETSDSQIDLLIQTALEKHSQKITEYKKGKKGLISLFVGEVMKLSKGNVDAKLVTEKIIEKLKA